MDNSGTTPRMGMLTKRHHSFLHLFLVYHCFSPLLFLTALFVYVSPSVYSILDSIPSYLYPHLQNDIDWKIAHGHSAILYSRSYTDIDVATVSYLHHSLAAFLLMFYFYRKSERGSETALCRKTCGSDNRMKASRVFVCEEWSEYPSGRLI